MKKFLVVVLLSAATLVCGGSVAATVTVPGAPTITSVVAGNGQVAVSCKAPASNGGAAITKYTVTSIPGAITATGTICSGIIVKGLTNGVAYTFTAFAMNKVGSGPSSAASVAVTPATIPGAPTNVVGNSGNVQVSVSFTAPASNGGSTITKYTATSTPGAIVAIGTTSPIIVPKLTNGTAYTFKVYATNKVGTGPSSAASAAVTPATVPGAPTITSVVAGNAQVTVSCTAPASNGGSAITSYTATTSTGISAMKASCPIVVTGLVNGVSVTVKVAAANKLGYGPSSAASAAVTPATVPGAPINVVAIVGDKQATVSCTAPSNGGSPITSYVVTSTPGAITATGTTCSGIVVPKLIDNVAYTFVVKATNKVGTGPTSAPSAAVTPEPTPVISFVSPPIQHVVGAEIVPFVFYGKNFTPSTTLTCSTNINILMVQVTSSTQITVYVGFDGHHDGYGAFPCNVSNNGVVSNAIPIGFYGKKLCDVLPSGEKVSANSLNGNADFFAPVTGAFEKTVSGDFNLNACGIASDPLTGYWTNGIEPYDQTGQQSLNAPNLTGGSALPCVANAAGNGFIAAIDADGLTYGNWVGAHVNRSVTQALVGSNPQSLAIGVTSGKTWAYVFDAGPIVTGTPAIGKVNLTDGMTGTSASWPTTGITAGAIGGSWMTVFDSLGLGVIVSPGDNVANVFSEDTLKPVLTFGNGGIIALPTGKTPISIIRVKNVAIIGNWDGTVGTFTELNPATGKVTLLPSSMPSMPIGLVPAVAADGVGVDFWVCPQIQNPQTNQTKCVPFTLPQ